MSVVFNDYMPKIWNTLVAFFGNEIGAAAMMGNLYAESGCTPYACQPSRPYSTCMTYIANVDTHTINEYSFVHRGCSESGGVASGQGGFGLAQWTYYTRKQALYNKWLTYGGSIGDLDLQLSYLEDELLAGYYSVYTEMCNATDLRTASNYVLFNFENPRDKSQAVQDLRYSYSLDIYNQYAGTTPAEPVNPQPSPVNPPSPTPQDPLSDTGNLKHRMPIWMYPSLRY